VSERIHDDEPDTSEATVRALLAAQCPQWAARPLTYLATSGTDNAMWRAHARDGGDDVVVRLPRRPRAAANMAAELDLLARLSSALAGVVRTPVVHHVGTPEEVFAHTWAVLGWLAGTDGWTARDELDADADALAVDMAGAIDAIGALTDLPVDRRGPGERGGPIGPLLDRIDWWLTDPKWNAPSLVDVAAVRRLADEAREVVDEPVPLRFVHGDLIAGNVLVDGGRLAAVIDWGSAGWADPAQDLSPAWAIFDGASRRRFRDAIGADDATWLRARTFELEQALGGVLYYVPRRHPLGDLMARTLQRILAAA
jgi:aminoglycoside phosphotransferase (APT) family kinase protein